MSEFALRILGAVIQMLVELLFELTGRKIFSLLGLKPSRFFNVPVGFVAWIVFGVVLTGVIIGIVPRHHS